MKNRNAGSSLAFQLVLLALVCQEGNPGKVIHSVIGPYIAYSERFYMCEPNSSLLPWTLNLRGSHFNPYKPKKLQLLTGNVTGVNVLLDKHGWTKIILDIRSNNQWKENAFVFNFNKKGACQVCKEQGPNFYKQIFKGEDKGACIIQPGVYEANNTPVDWINPKVPLMPYGSYRFRLTFGNAENLYACWVIHAKTIPKTD
ncbi:uncharacterized protein LOC127749169 [Frankliniella occidentalis]|uniref:Uncharacterized protein LOC127749169 n=1 Tax=Frankliniella occidentalis TaxID=133901 RepID=A0A9C6TTY8_FRAOC|nr:uncharacterized protein LOC127749169 [Frankliniella occidentalis]